jgi:hypothetical protein
MFDMRDLSKPLHHTKLHDRPIRKTCINNKLLVTCSEDTNARVCKLDQYSLSQVYEFTEHIDYCVDALWHPSKDYELVTCSWDGFIKKHDLSKVL